jgi:hypothetical protein
MTEIIFLILGLFIIYLSTRFHTNSMMIGINFIQLLSLIIGISMSVVCIITIAINFHFIYIFLLIGLYYFLKYYYSKK